jgi:hypothetical protein
MGKTLGKDPWRLRKCKACKISYKPMCRDKANAEKSIFCTRACKDRYHRSGGMNIVQLREVLTRAIIKALKEDDAFLEAIADKVRVVNGRVLTDGGLMSNVLERALQMPRSGGTSPNESMACAPGDH